jgi:hypothetical protein
MINSAKIVARRALPNPIYHRARESWKRASQLGEYTWSVARSVDIARRFGLPEVIIRFGYGLGDDLLCTAVLRELRKRRRGELWMISNYP